MKLIETTLLPLSAIEPNHGQIDGLPKNPRVLRDAKYNALKKSITDNPEMLALRELLVYKHGDKYIIIGGNMRYRALKDLKYKDAPCKVIPADTPVETLRAYVIKDNGDFGQWDYDALANDWDADDLNDWGVDVWQDKEVDDVFKDKPEAPTGGSSAPLSPEAAEILANEQDNYNPVDFGGNLPAELQGVDLNPENLPKIQGTDETPFERIIIVYSKDRKGEICSLLGLPDINKVVYHLDEILGEAHPTATEDEE